MGRIGWNSSQMSCNPSRLLLLLFALPLLIFDATFLSPAVGLPAAVLTVAALALGYRGFDATDAQHFDLPILAICLLIATIGCLVGGQGRIFYAADDWIIRDAVLADLVSNSWPPSYNLDNQSVILRAPLGMYLLPALVGRLAGVAAAHTALVIQNILIFALILFELSRTHVRPAGRVVLILLFLLFSGLDVVPWAIRWGVHFKDSWEIPSHLEWWADEVQYSSHVTQLFWAPQHAFAGWVFAAFYLRWRQGSLGAPPLSLVFGLCLFWSPLAAMGALPFLLFACVVDLHRRKIRVAHLAAPMLLLLAVIPVGLYLLMDGGDIRRQLLILEPGFWATYIAFLVIEVVPFYLILRASPSSTYLIRRVEFALIFIMLGLFPLYTVGASNDFTMRASIPALAILAMLVMERVYVAVVERQASRVWMAAVVIVGAATPAIEIARAFIRPADQYSSCSLPEAWRNSRFAVFPMAAYIARHDHPWRTWLLRDSGNLQPVDFTIACRDISHESEGAPNVQPTNWLADGTDTPARIPG